MSSFSSSRRLLNDVRRLVRSLQCLLDSSSSKNSMFRFV
jgi:hypothetical protein